MTAPTRVWTWEDALKLPDGERYEVINGELKERTMSYRSSEIASIFVELLRAWARAHQPGRVTGSDGGFTIFPWTAGDVRMPDAAYISKERLPRSPARGWVSVAPELTVEVISPNDLFSDAEDKAKDYIRAGVDLVWVVVPNSRSVHIWRRDGSRSIVQAGEVLSGENVLPGFEMPVAELFEEETED
jgi:Uma2 family endonuclease